MAIPPTPNDARIQRLAALLAEMFAELQQSALEHSGAEAISQEIAAARHELENVAARLDRQLGEEREQRLLLAGQLTGLASSLDGLVNHLQGLSALMGRLLEGQSGVPAATSVTSEPAFAAGGEGLSLVLGSVPGFQALMEIQKALMSLAQVTGVSVERFQEGESRLLVHLSAAITAVTIVDALKEAGGFNIVVEEARPEFSRLRLKIIPA